MFTKRLIYLSTVNNIKMSIWSWTEYTGEFNYMICNYAYIQGMEELIIPSVAIQANEEDSQDNLPSVWWLNYAN